VIKNRKGIGLLEVIAALGITAVVLTSLVSLSVFVLRSSLRGKLLLEGTKISNREIELVRAYRDQPEVSWQAFVGSLSGHNCGSVHCHMSPNGTEILSELVIRDGGTPQEISYGFLYEDLLGAGEIIRISVEVSWKDAGVTKSTRIYTDFTNWQQK